WFRARRGIADDRRGRRLVRVSRVDESAERDALRRGRALGLGPPLPASARRSRPPRTTSPRNRRLVSNPPWGAPRCFGTAASLSSGHAYVFHHHTQRATGRF